MAKKITFCSACVAISAVLLLLANILPYNTAFLLCAATVPYPLSKIKCGGKYSACALAAGVLIAFMFLADKFFWIVFSALGVYSLLKGEIEKTRNLWLEIILKAILYMIAVSGMFYFFKGTTFLMLTAVGAVVFVIYDVALSVFISYIRRKIRF